DAGMTWSDIDAVVIGKAPDMFEGVAMPELYLADALGAVGKPMIRVHTAGSVGGSTSIVAAKLVAAGVHERVLTVAYEKQSESNATWGLSVPMPFAAPLVAGAGGYFAPLIRAYMYRSGAPRYIGHLVAVKDRLAALRNPKAHLHLPDIDLKTVEESFLLWDPLRYLDVCPSSDGAMAMVMGSETVADASEGPVAWIHGMAMRSEPTMFARRDQINPQAGKDCAQDLYAQAGITNEFAMDFSERVRQAQAIVAETAKCSPEDALELMTSAADLDDESLEQVAGEVLSGRLHFSPPE